MIWSSARNAAVVVALGAAPGWQEQEVDLSRLLGCPIRDSQGERIASLRDVIVRLVDGETPVVTGLVARLGRSDIFLPVAEVIALGESGVDVAPTQMDARSFQRRAGEILLHDDLLDKQVIDLAQKRVVRVSDIVVEQRQEHYVLTGIEIGARAVINRLALSVPGLRSTRPVAHGEILPWSAIEPFATSAPEALLSLAHERLSQLSSADLARIADEISYRQGVELVESLDDELAADTLAEMDDEFRNDVVEHLDEDRAADILEAMPADTAAEVLDDLPVDTADRLLAQMSPDEADDVAELLSYPEDSVGRLMSADYFAQPATTTVAEALAALRVQLADTETDIFHYTYVLAAPERPALISAVALRDLLLAEADQPLSDLVQREIPTVSPTDAARDAALMLVEHNLLALPVVDEQRTMLGVLTLDNVLDILVPMPSDYRLPRIFGAL